MTQKIEFLPKRVLGQAQKSAKERELLAERWLRAQALPELRKQRLEPTELSQQPVWRRLENPLMRKRARRTAKQQEHRRGLLRRCPAPEVALHRR